MRQSRLGVIQFIIVEDGHVVVVGQVHLRSVFKMRVHLAHQLRSKVEEIEPWIEERM